MHILLFFGLFVAALALATQAVSVAQGPPPGPQAGPLKVHQLTPSIYWIEGGVGNCGFIIGEKGVIVIDTTISPAGGKELLSNVAKITLKPVTTIILTHGDIDHIGGLAAFPAGLEIIAQENNKKNMEAAFAAGRRTVSTDHLPHRAVTKNREAVEIEGVKLELLHWAPAHTAGDLVVYLPDQKIVFTGDVFALDQFRALVHREQGGSSEGWITSAKGVIALNADRFVVGHGDVQTKESLQKRTGEAEAEREKIKELVAKGMSLHEIQAAVGDPPPGQSKPGPGGPRFTAFSEVVYQELTETQIGDIMTTNGDKYPPDPNAIEDDRVISLVVDDFQQLEFNDPNTGTTLKYNLYIPKDYDANRSYPLVLFVHDRGVVSADTRMTLIQGLGGVIWATPLEQAKHKSFVLAPQYSRAIVNDQSEATQELDVTVNLVKALVNQYNIDRNRLYTTGQSMGCMASIEMLIKYPDLFAAALLVAGQWDATKMSVLTKANMWVIVSEGDRRAFPGMNASMAALEAAGAKISRATWDGRAGKAEQAANVSKMIAEGNNIKYTALAKGTVVPEGVRDEGPVDHVHTWPIAYAIEGLRDWLFTQAKTTN